MLASSQRLKASSAQELKMLQDELAEKNIFVEEHNTSRLKLVVKDEQIHQLTS